jgi:DNA-binding ferritin-like protein
MHNVYGDSTVAQLEQQLADALERVRRLTAYAIAAVCVTKRHTFVRSENDQIAHAASQSMQEKDNELQKLRRELKALHV